MPAREYFETVRDAAVELDRTSRTLERMRARTMPKAQRYDAVGGGSGHSDPMDRVVEVVDFEAVMRQRMEDDRELLSDAARVLYGEDGREGVAKGMGSAYADAVYHRALDARTWDGVARVMFMSRSKVQQLYDSALDYVDSAGLDGATAGVQL